jgi:demethylmenaquinone methyltransferase/2-methoxy-6-polyprenyl-1,4-benzoquinol methylase
MVGFPLGNLEYPPRTEDVNRLKPREQNNQTEPERRLRQLNLREEIDDPATRQRLVTTVFDVVSRTYDRFTAVFSYGMDQHWKRQLLDQLAAQVPADASVLDLACGTGDLALRVGRLVPGARVFGLDISTRMLRVARHRSRASAPGVAYCLGDMTRLPLSDSSVAAVTASYATRNAPEYGRALDEIARVLEPGGLLGTLDFYRPANPLWRLLFLTYLRLAGNLFGWVWHRAAAAYGYIAPSVRRFVSRREFTRALEARGFVVERVYPKLWGGICIHVARLAERADRPDGNPEPAAGVERFGDSFS